MTARIYRPSPNAMQSGKGKSKHWVLVHEPATPREIEPLMGYTASGDTRTQVRLAFDTLEAAEAYARKNGIAYTVQPAHDTSVKHSSYPDNFRFDRKTPWTH
ncbi:MAG: ETC complex I subunit [Devosia sp.]